MTVDNIHAISELSTSLAGLYAFAVETVFWYTVQGIVDLFVHLQVK